VRRFLDSLADQRPRVAALIVVDASEGDDTRAVLQDHPGRTALADSITYCHVEPPLAGLTRQSNFGLSLVRTDLVAYFDDDVVLLPGCVAEMELAHRDHPDIVGVGANIENKDAAPSLRWRLRRLLFVVPSLAPGRYFRSGRTTPWWRLASTAGLVEGDWLSGGAVMWKTAAARATGFAENFVGYGAGNDVEFSLRISRFGRQAVSAGARLLHLQEAGGRPDPFALGYSWMVHRRRIHRVGGGEGLAAKCWFGYGVAVELALHCADLVRPALTRRTWDYLRGMTAALREREA
jgi:GT2 family glycosyltransferase